MNLKNSSIIRLKIFNPIFLITLFCCFIAFSPTHTSSLVANIELNNSENDTIKFTISFVGDIMVHQTQLDAQKSADGTYCFVNNFTPMKDVLSHSDISIGNLETTFAGAAKRYQGYPRFNSPDALAEAIKYSGINLVVTANNHSYDHGGSAVLRTIEVLKNHELDYVGTRTSTDEKPYIIREIDGVRIAITAYTYESGKRNGLKTINGITVLKDHQDLINSFDPNSPDEDLKKMKEIIDSMKVDNAEFIVFVMHWGAEYSLMHNQKQKHIAQKLNEFGVDVIFGSHPHVVQPLEFIVNDSTKHLTFVAYSAGNFISNQRFESRQNYSTEDGLFVGVEIIKPKNEKPRLDYVFYEPTWVNRYRVGNNYSFEVIPVNAYLANRDSISLSTEQWKRIEGSQKRTTERISTPISNQNAEFLNKYVRRYLEIFEDNDKNLNQIKN